MIATLVQISLPEPMTLEAANDRFLKTAPKYLGVSGLVRKDYLLSMEGSIAGAFYLWESEVAARAFFDEIWHQFIREKYGSTPSITYFTCPVVVDNQEGEIREV